MKIFFTGSPRALSTFKNEHEKIYSIIEKLGYKNLSNLVINANPDSFYTKEHGEVVEHYKETIQNLKTADIIVAEVSLHSMSMGYLVEKALNMGKPVIVLHLPDKKPFFFFGIENEKLQIIEYTLETVDLVLKDAISFAIGKQDVRFNFFISPSIGLYLDWISMVKKIPRSVYLRTLIEKDIDSNEEYQNVLK